MNESTRLAVTRLESILADNAGNRLTYALMRGLHAQMTEMLVEVLEPADQPPARGAQLVASGTHEVTGGAR